MNNTTPTRRGKASEAGYLLVSVMFMLAILVIAMSVAVPRIAKSIQRDRELETIHRGKQYARAVKLYYKKFGAYPPNLDALVKTNEIRFLRKKYIDPTTGKDEWKPVRYGQNKSPTAMGFFGQPLTGAGMGGGGLCGNALPSSIPSSGSSSTFGGSSSSFGSSSSSFGSSSSSFGSSSSSFGSSSSSFGSSTSFGSSNPMAGCPPSTDNSNTTATNTSGANIASGNANGSTDPNNPNSSTDPNNPNAGQNSGNGSTNGPSTPGLGTGIGTGTGTGLTGQQFGGGAIIGFSPTSPKQSILLYKKKNHFNEWEFVYDPIAEQMMQQGGAGGNGLGGNGLGGNGVGGNGVGGFGNNGNGGFGNNGGGFGNSGGGFGNSGGGFGSTGGFGSSGGSGTGGGITQPQPQ